MIGRYAIGKKIKFTRNKAVKTEVRIIKGAHKAITLKLKMYTPSISLLKSFTKKLIMSFVKNKVGKSKINKTQNEITKKLKVMSNPTFSFLFSLKYKRILTNGGETWR